MTDLHTKWAINDALDDMFTRLYHRSMDDLRTIETMTEMGYTDLADAYQAWTQGDKD